MVRTAAIITLLMAATSACTSADTGTGTTSGFVESQDETGCECKAKGDEVGVERLTVDYASGPVTFMAWTAMQNAPGQYVGFELDHEVYLAVETGQKTWRGTDRTFTSPEGTEITHVLFCDDDGGDGGGDGSGDGSGDGDSGGVE